MNLILLEPLLQPFYNRSLMSLTDVKEHFDRLLGVSADGRECLNIERLVNVSENWAEVEIYFRDVSDTVAGTEDIQRLVKMYQETGQFMSTLSAHPSGATLSFTYQQRGGAMVSLTPELLQVHVQLAVLGGDVQELEDFVASFGIAQRLHAVRLVLEEEGHPDYQAIVSPPVSCHLDAVTYALTTLTRNADQWREEVGRSFVENPRILLLNRRSRVQFLLTLREHSLSTSRELLPYIVQCFPKLLRQRLSISKALDAALETIEEHQLGDSGAQDLDIAKQLIDSIEACLLKDVACAGIEFSIDSENENTYEPIILNLQGLTASQIYSYHLSDMITQNLEPALPGLVLWCAATTTETDIHNILSVARTFTLCNVVHIVGVDLLTHRMREVLLRGIEKEKLRALVQLIFSDGEGMDTFAQYELETAPPLRNPSDLRKHLLASSRSLPEQSQMNATVFVVAGNRGTGKSYWVKARLGSVNNLSFTVHEGFSVADVITRYKELLNKLGAGSKCQTIDLYFNILQFANFELFSRFLHHLLVLGLIIDDQNGSCLAILPGISLKIYIELPEIAVKNGSVSSLWPDINNDTWNTLHHSFLKLLPTLEIAVAPSDYISIRKGMPFEINAKAQLVASYLHLAEGPENDIHAVTLPTPLSPDLLGLAECPRLLKELFDRHNVGISKRVRNCVIEALYERFLYVETMQVQIEL